MCVDDLVAWVDIIGTIAGILVMSSSIPQIMKAYKTKKMSDLSIHLMSLIASGLFLWVIYGFIKSDPVIIGTNASRSCLNVSLLVMKLRYDKMQNSTCKNNIINFGVIAKLIQQSLCSSNYLIQYLNRQIRKNRTIGNFLLIVTRIKRWLDKRDLHQDIG